MPQRDTMHNLVKQALSNAGWKITNDPYRIYYGERSLFVDLGAVERFSQYSAAGQLVGAEREGRRIAIEIKEFRGNSVIVDLEHAIGQYVLYRLLLNKVEPDRELYLAITDEIFEDIFSEPIGEVVIKDLPMQLIVIDLKQVEVKRWITSQTIATL
jgi:hypothetical protein